mmetsp:Transcript_150/g.601  ORF Transcript_150/g.601 Transcript_150/m.601 type:complete len:276 (-) Transcript_150:1412-2239(-)
MRTTSFSISMNSSMVFERVSNMRANIDCENPMLKMFFRNCSPRPASTARMYRAYVKSASLAMRCASTFRTTAAVSGNLLNITLNECWERCTTVALVSVNALPVYTVPPRVASRPKVSPRRHSRPFAITRPLDMTFMLSAASPTRKTYSWPAYTCTCACTERLRIASAGMSHCLNSGTEATPALFIASAASVRSCGERTLKTWLSPCALTRPPALPRVCTCLNRKYARMRCRRSLGNPWSRIMEFMSRSSERYRPDLDVISPKSTITSVRMKMSKA